MKEEQVTPQSNDQIASPSQEVTKLEATNISPDILGKKMDDAIKHKIESNSTASPVVLGEKMDDAIRSIRTEKIGLSKHDLDLRSQLVNDFIKKQK